MKLTEFLSTHATMLGTLITAGLLVAGMTITGMMLASNAKTPIDNKALIQELIKTNNEILKIIKEHAED